MQLLPNQNASFCSDGNLVPRVLGLFGQRVVARRVSAIMDFTSQKMWGSSLSAHAWGDLTSFLFTSSVRMNLKTLSGHIPQVTGTVHNFIDW